MYSCCDIDLSLQTCHSQSGTLVVRQTVCFYSLKNLDLNYFSNGSSGILRLSKLARHFIVQTIVLCYTLYYSVVALLVHSAYSLYSITRQKKAEVVHHKSHVWCLPDKATYRLQTVSIISKRVQKIEYKTDIQSLYCSL